MCIKFSLGEYDVKYQLEILIIKTQKIYYFSTLFWKRTLHVSGRFTVHHQESLYCIHSNWYL